MTGDGSGDPGVRRVDLGGGSRRWLLVAAAVVVVWVLAAVTIGGGGDGDDDASETPRASTSTSSVVRSTTTTTAVAASPLAGAGTGWHLVAATGGGGVVVELDTGLVRRLDIGPVVAVRTDGVVTYDGDRLLWRPFPFDDATAVDLGSVPDGLHPAVVPSRSTDAAWVLLQPGGGPAGVRRVALRDGSVLAETELPAGAWTVGDVGGDLVVGAAGDTFALDGAGAARLVSAGTPHALVDGSVVVQRCAGDLRCAVLAVDVRTGAERALPGFDVARSYPIGPPHPGGGVLVGSYEPGAERVSLVGLDGSRPALPEEVRVDRLWGAAWSPDGDFLFVPGLNRVDVVDVFAEGGPTVVGTIEAPPLDGNQLAVVQLRTED